MAKEAKEGIALLEGKINNVSYNEEVLWYIDLPEKIKMSKAIYLLPNYDEYIVGYTNRDALMPENNKSKLSREGNPLFINTIIINGQVCDTWKRTLKTKEVVINSTVFDELSMANKKQLEQAELRFKKFLSKS